MKPENFNVHYIFCTHDHLDHTDPVSLPIIARTYPDTLFFGPREACEHLVDLGVRRDRVKALEAGTPYSVGDLKVTAFYSVPPEEAETTHFGYLFEVDEVKIYNMGDTYQSVVENPEKILRPVVRENPDIAILPIVGDTSERKLEDVFLSLNS